MTNLCCGESDASKDKSQLCSSKNPCRALIGLADNNLFALQAHLQAPRCSPVKPAQIALDPLAESLPVLGDAHQAVLEIVREIPCRESSI